MKKNLLICLLFVILGVNFAFGDEKNVGTLVKDPNERYRATGKDFKCARVVDGYIAEIDGYDFINGIVECRIKGKTDEGEIKRAENANVQYYELSYQHWFIEKERLGAFAPIYFLTDSFKAALGLTEPISEIQYDDKGTTLTDFIVGLAVLNFIDPDNVNGVTENKTKINNDGVVENIESETSNIAKGFNKANTKYFESLFKNMNTVYIHLQNLLFVVVGGFFLATLGGQKIQKYLENRGQSTGQKEPYLHKFFIPLLCAAVFYMPISGSGGVNSTIIQKIIQYFTIEATAIANRASAIGLQSYAEKVRNDFLKSNNNLTLIASKSDKMMAEFMVEMAQKELPKCIERYKNNVNAFIDNETLKWVEMEAQKNTSFFKSIFNNISEKFTDLFKAPNNTTEISLKACKFLVETYSNYQYLKQSYAKYENEIKNEMGKEMGKEQIKANETFSGIQERLSNNEKMYGWIHSAIAPATMLLFEAQKDSKKLKAYKQQKTGTIEQISKDIENKTLRKTQEPTDPALLNELLAFSLGRAVIFLLPGATNIFKLVKDTGYLEMEEQETGLKKYIPTNLTAIIKALKIAFIAYYGEAVPSSFLSILSGFIGEKDGLLNIYISIEFVYLFYNMILEKFPILLVSIAGMLAFLSYFVTLCKYFYISPFVVAFALTTKRVDKIINFLVTGIVIFFKPVLIVMFIYLALFLITILQDLYLTISAGQFIAFPAGTFNSNSIDLASPIIKTTIKLIMQLLGSLAAIYIVWKTIMTGPDWTFKLLGLDSSGDNTIVRDLSNKMEQKSVQI